MALPWTDRRQARLFVGDTGGLMNDILATTRRGFLTSLPAALHHDSVLLYLPRHVVIEVERNLPEYATKTLHPVEPDAAVRTWREMYAPCIRVVDVPQTWGLNDSRVEAVSSRHSPDAPTARLASALAECYVLARDGDLTDYFGKHEHLDLLLAAANEGELNYVSQAAALPVMLLGLAAKGAVHGFRKLPPAAHATSLLAAGVLGYYWQRNGQGARRLKQAAAVAAQAFQVIGPPLHQLFERRRANEEVWAAHVVPRAGEQRPSEQVARILAFAPDQGMLAGEIADELDIPGSAKSRTAVVRDALKGCAAFTEVSRHRWRLGHGLADERPNLAPEARLEWLVRAHRGPIRGGAPTP